MTDSGSDNDQINNTHSTQSLLPSISSSSSSHESPTDLAQDNTRPAQSRPRRRLYRSARRNHVFIREDGFHSFPCDSCESESGSESEPEHIYLSESGYYPWTFNENGDDSRLGRSNGPENTSPNAQSAGSTEQVPDEAETLVSESRESLLSQDLSDSSGDHGFNGTRSPPRRREPTAEEMQHIIEHGASDGSSLTPLAERLPPTIQRLIEAGVFLEARLPGSWHRRADPDPVFIEEGDVDLMVAVGLLPLPSVQPAPFSRIGRGNDGRSHDSGWGYGAYQRVHNHRRHGLDRPRRRSFTDEDGVFHGSSDDEGSECWVQLAGMGLGQE